MPFSAFFPCSLRSSATNSRAIWAVAFDLHGPTFRHKDYSEYKAGRKPTAPELRPQFDLVRECLEKMGVKILTCPTFEADDILGTFARRCEEAGIPALLVTGDRDSMQLVTKTSNVLYTRRGVSDVVRYTPEKVLEDFGVTPAQIPDLKGLMGDASDNIPGIPGIGEKTAIKLLSAYGTLENALDHAEADLKGKQREKMIDGRMSGLMSKKIATITRYVPLDDVTLEDCRLGDMRGVLPLFEQLGLKTLTVRLLQLSGLRAEENAPAAPQIAWQDERQLLSEAEISTFISALPTDARTALLMREDSVSLAAENGAQALIPYAQGLLGGGLDPLCAAKALAPLLTGARPLILWNAKRLKTEFASWGLPVTAVFDDDQIMQYLLAPQNGKYEAPENAAALLQQTLSDERALDEQEMTKLYREIELPLLSTLYDMERDGFLVDCDELNRLGAQYDQQIAELKDEIFSLCGVAPFNLNSPQQLGSVLFDTLGLPAKKKTARGYSTDAETLNELAELHPAVDKILLYRQVAKLKSTYIDGLLRLTAATAAFTRGSIRPSPRRGAFLPASRICRISPCARRWGAKSAARSSPRQAAYSSMRITRRSNCVCSPIFPATKRCAKPSRWGRTFTPERRRRSTACRSTKSRHRCVPARKPSISASSTASAISVWLLTCTSPARKPPSLSRAILPATRRFIGSWMRASVRARRKDIPSQCTGRRRPLPELSSPNYNRRQFGERAAMNTPVQGAAADIIKIAMNAVHDELKASGLTAKLILQVHDELIVEAPEEEREQVETLLRRCMENAASLRVPLIADVHSGRSWYDTK